VIGPLKSAHHLIFLEPFKFYFIRAKGEANTTLMHLLDYKVSKSLLELKELLRWDRCPCDNIIELTTKIISRQSHQRGWKMEAESFFTLRADQVSLYGFWWSHIKFNR